MNTISRTEVVSGENQHKKQCSLSKRGKPWWDWRTFGGEHWMTRSTSGMSRPRAATLVATNTSNVPFLKPLSVISLCFWGMSPCSDCALWTTTDTNTGCGHMQPNNLLEANTLINPKDILIGLQGVVYCRSFLIQQRTCKPFIRLKTETWQYCAMKACNELLFLCHKWPTRSFKILISSWSLWHINTHINPITLFSIHINSTLGFVNQNDFRYEYKPGQCWWSDVWAPVWWMRSWRAPWPLSWSRRRRWSGRGCRCTPEWHHRWRTPAGTSDTRSPGAALARKQADQSQLR